MNALTSILANMSDGSAQETVVDPSQAANPSSTPHNIEVKLPVSHGSIHCITLVSLASNTLTDPPRCATEAACTSTCRYEPAKYGTRTAGIHASLTTSTDAQRPTVCCQTDRTCKGGELLSHSSTFSTLVEARELGPVLARSNFPEEVIQAANHGNWQALMQALDKHAKRSKDESPATNQADATMDLD